jgi:hypothetical protein
MKQKQKELILIPIGWLGNRIRTISAAHSFAKQYNKKLKIYWMTYDQGMKLPYAKVFEQLDGVELVELKSKAIWFIIQSITKLVKLMKLRNIGKFTILIGRVDVNEKILNDPNDLIIRTDGRFFPFENIPLQFERNIRESGDKFLDSIGGEFIGMHVRRGNNREAIKNSPLSLFIDAAKEEVFQKGNKIFLCTDDTTIKKTFKEIFEESVFTREVVLEHSSEAHTVDAAIDLYCLSKSIKIYGTYFSSFSTISAEFNNVPFERLQNKCNLPT